MQKKNPQVNFKHWLAVKNIQKSEASQTFKIDMKAEKNRSTNTFFEDLLHSDFSKFKSILFFSLGVNISNLTALLKNIQTNEIISLENTEFIRVFSTYANQNALHYSPRFCCYSHPILLLFIRFFYFFLCILLTRKVIALTKVLINDLS